MNGKEKEIKIEFCYCLLYIGRVVFAYNVQFDAKEIIR